MSVLKVNIYIYIRQKGKLQGMGSASALLEYADSKGMVHTRTADVPEKDCTRNRIALEVTVMALKMLVKPCEVVIHTDNRYIKSCIANGWLEKWQQDGWVKPDGSAPANINLWRDLCISSQIHKIKFMPYKERQEFKTIGKEGNHG